jgi:two-component system, OmpR family, KDP operon response regulator KdpE
VAGIHDRECGAYENWYQAAWNALTGLAAPDSSLDNDAQRVAGGVMNARVLVIGGEPQFVRVIRFMLQERGYELEAASSGQAGYAVAARRPPVLVVLDLDLPDMNGVGMIRRLRRWSRASIVVLSGRARSRDMVEALDAGADDYVTKPFEMDELLARLRAALRRAGDVSDIASVPVGVRTVDLARHAVTGPDGGVDLTPTEWEILEVLVRNAGRLVSQSQLLTEVGGSAYLRDSDCLRVYVTRLRRKLEDDPARPLHLITEPGMGYRFCT